MDIQNLEAFLLVAEQGSFSGAAEALHITQPAVSKRIAALEQQLGDSLFDRIGRSVTLTEAGRALLPHAEAISGHLRQARQSIDDLSGEVTGRLKLGTSHHIGLHRLPPVLRQYSEAYPGVALDIDFMDSEQAVDELTRGNVEIAVVTLAPEPAPNIVSTPVWDDPLDFMATADHPLAGLGPLPLSSFCDYPVILPGLTTFTGRIVRQLFEAEGLKLDITLSTNYLETIRMMAAVGLGWTLLPRTMLQAPLVALDVPGASPRRQLGLLYHRNRRLSNAAQAFNRLLN
ncbi:MAG: LysR family transcriptional regulator [Halieaceae bacterium]|nr:LysR family transcriptional regulator [Halieaceae bacterium]